MKYGRYRYLNVFFIFCTVFLSQTTFAAEEKSKITCYNANQDADNDGYAKEGAASKEFEVPQSTRYNCPTGYVKDAGDCNDNNGSVHPYRSEIAFNSRDDNCNDEADENEFVYFTGGNSNSDTSYRLRVKVNNADVMTFYNAGYPIFAKVLYRKITQDSSSDQETGYMRVSFSDYNHDRLGSYTGTNVNLSGLSKTTVYRNRVKFYYQDAGSYKPIGIYGPSVYYTSTTDVNNSTSEARTGILLRAFHEYFYQSLGLVGKTGSVWINGTRYGADTHELWCTEFYSWVTQWDLKNSYPITNTSKMADYFGNNFSLVSNGDDLNPARRADWLAIDWQDDGSKDHSAMFLGIYHDGRIVTIEGNTGNRVKIQYRDVSDIYGLGHITSGKVK